MRRAWQAVVSALCWAVTITCWYLAWADRHARHGLRHPDCPLCKEVGLSEPT